MWITMKKEFVKNDGKERPIQESVRTCNNAISFIYDRLWYCENP